MNSLKLFPLKFVRLKCLTSLKLGEVSKCLQAAYISFCRCLRHTDLYIMQVLTEARVIYLP